MKFTIEKQPNCKATLVAEIPSEALEKARSEAATYVSRNASLPGFRPGKVPLTVVQKRFADHISSRAIQQVGDKALQEGAKSENLRVYSVDEAKADSINPDGSTKITFSLTLHPEVTLPAYKGLKANIETVEVTDEMVIELIVKQSEQFATMNEVTDRPCRMGDFCVINYVGKVGDELIKDIVSEKETFLAENTELLIKLDGSNFLPGFLEQLEGVQAGESREVRVNIPAESGSSISGQEAVYSVTVTTIKEQELPALDDELANRFISGKTMDEIKAILKERATEDVARRQEEQKRERVLDALVAQADFDLPEKMISETAQRRINELVQTNLNKGVPQEMLREHEATIVGVATAQAQKDLKREFLLAEIIKAESLKLEENELNQAVASIAQANGLPTAKALKQLKKSKQIENIGIGLLMDKATRFLVDNAELTFIPASPQIG